MSQFYQQFRSIAQPIVSKNTLDIYAMEILSRSAQVFDVGLFFKTMSTHESMLFTCSQFELLDKVDEKLRVNINAVNDSILDMYFLNELERVNTSRIAIEIDFFTPNTKKIDEMIKIVNHIKSLGCEVWLDDYRLSDDSNLLLSIPWTGVKIDKESVWGMMEKDYLLEGVIQGCKNNGFLVTLEGVENKFIYDLVRHTSADFFQGYYWPAKIYDE